MKRKLITSSGADPATEQEQLLMCAIREQDVDYLTAWCVNNHPNKSLVGGEFNILGMALYINKIQSAVVLMKHGATWRGNSQGMGVLIDSMESERSPHVLAEFLRRDQEACDNVQAQYVEQFTSLRVFVPNDIFKVVLSYAPQFLTN